MTPICCKNNGILWRRIAFFVMVFILLIAISFSYFAFFHKGTGSCDNLCTGGKCHGTTKAIVERLDVEVQPCQDFYSFACGNFIKTHENKTDYGVDQEMEETLRMTVKEILTEIPSNSSTNAGKLKTVYDSCIDYSSSEMNAIPSVSKLFKLLGMEEWPNLPKDFRFVNPSLEEAIGILIGYNQFPFLQFVRDQTTSKEIFKFKVNGKQYKMLEKAEKVLHQIVNHFNPYQNANNIVKDYVSISNEVSSVLPVGTCEDDCGYQTWDVNCSSATQRQLKLICDVAHHVVKHNHLEKYYTSDSIVINNGNPVLLLNDIQNFYNHTALANYIALDFLIRHANFLDSFIQNALLEYLRLQLNLDELVADKTSNCVFGMLKSMPQPLAQLYVSKKLPMHMLKDVNSIFEEIKEAADIYIKEQAWMDENLKADLRSGLFKVKGSPMLWVKYLTDGTFDKLIEDYFPSPSSFLWNAMDYLKHEFNFKLLNTIPPEALEVDKVFMSRAAYNKGLVALQFGILLPPFYDYNRPRWMNVASLGYVIGHEIGHNIYQHFQVSETSETSFEKLRTKVICIANQLSNYTYISGEKVNGERVHAEAVVDIIGMQLVEKVMNKMKDDIQPICVPELPYSTKQLVYMVLAQSFCETDAIKENLEDEHAENRHRITLITQSSEEFSAAYQCPGSSYMNIQNRCKFFD